MRTKVCCFRKLQPQFRHIEIGLVYHFLPKFHISDNALGPLWLLLRRSIDQRQVQAKFEDPPGVQSRWRPAPSGAVYEFRRFSNGERYEKYASEAWR